MHDRDQDVTWLDCLAGRDCPLCGPQPDANEYKIKIAPLRISTLYLFRDQRFRGYCLLIFDRYHATSLVRLPLDEYHAFTQDLRQAGAALEAALRPDHMNYELLGNSGPHLHWHIIHRYTDTATPTTRAGEGQSGKSGYATSSICIV
jgi:diadenosine tetraphosphate (Ap4A) HIT family hydrolase